MNKVWVVFWSLFAATALPFYSYAILCSLSYSDPVIYTKVVMETPVVMIGETMRLSMRYLRIKDCTLSRIRAIQDGSGKWHEIMREELPNPSPVDPDVEERLTVEIAITDAFKPGDANYRAILSYACPIKIGPFTIPNFFQDRSPHTVVFGPWPFTIEPRQ